MWTPCASRPRRLQLKQLIPQQRRPLEVQCFRGLRDLLLDDLHILLAVDLVGVGSRSLGDGGGLDSRFRN